MRITIVSPVYAPYYHLGGPAKSIPNLVNSLKKRGCKVRVVTQQHGDDDLSGDELIYIKGNLLDRLINRLLSLKVRVSPFESIVLMRDLIKKSDAIYLNCGYSLMNTIAGFYASMYGKKILFSPRGAGSPQRERNKYFLKSILRAFDYCVWMRKSTMVLLSKNEDAPNFYKLCKTIKYIPNIYNFNLLSNLPAKQNSIVFLGRPTKDKGWETFCQLASEFDARYKFIGIVTERPDFTNSSIELYVDPSQELIEKKLCKSSHFFLESRGEGMSMAILEAGSFGLIPIVNKKAIFPEIEKYCLLGEGLNEFREILNGIDMNGSFRDAKDFREFIYKFCNGDNVAKQFIELIK